MSNLTELIGILNLENCMDVADARSSLLDVIAQNIRVVPEVFMGAGPHYAGRFHLYTLHKGNMPTLLHHEANGIVLLFDAKAAPQWSCLVRPPHILNTVYDKADIIARVNLCEITAADDGTVVSLYYYAGEWNVSTARGMRMNEQIWSSNISYWMAVNDVMAKYGGMAALDVGCAYSICFHHPALHPFTAEIRARYLGAAQPGTMPRPEKVTFVNLPNEKIFNEMMRRNATSLNGYVTGRRIWYGYILRDGKNDVCLESDLFRNIKKIYYAQPRLNHYMEKTNQIIMQQVSLPKTRQLYVALRAYMNYRLKYVALSLFPEFNALYARFDGFFSNVAVEILSLIVGDKVLYKKDVVADKSTEMQDLAAKSLDRLVKIIVEHIKKVGGIDPTHSDSKSIVVDFLMDFEYIHVYVNYLHCIEQK